MSYEPGARWCDCHYEREEEELGLEDEVLDEGERLVVSNAKLDVRLLPGELVVAFIKRKHVMQASWLLLKVAMFLEGGEESSGQSVGQPAEEQEDEAGEEDEAEPFQPMRGIILDEDGCTLIMGKRHMPLLQEPGLKSVVDVAPHTWRALEFSLGHMVAEVPGIINHLAKLMADEKISILHQSTYASEIFLVRQAQVARAIHCIRRSVETTLALLCQTRSSTPPASNPVLIPTRPGDRDRDPLYPNPSTKPKPLHSSSSDTETLPPAAAGAVDLPAPCSDGESECSVSSYSDHGRLALKVLPDNLVLVRMHKDYLRDCSWGLTRLFLFDKAYETYRHPPSSKLGLLSFSEMEGEISMLLPEEDLRLFPSKALLVCPAKWIPIKLTGRRFNFYETGVVSAMSKVDAGIPILNISTYITSVTLVERQHLEQTLATLTHELEAIVIHSPRHN